METERIALSQRERDRLRVLHEVEQGAFDAEWQRRRRLQVNRPPGAAVAAAPARARRPGGDSRIARAALEPQVGGFASSRRFWRAYASAMRISDPRWPPNTWPRKVSR